MCLQIIIPWVINIKYIYIILHVGNKVVFQIMTNTLILISAMVGIINGGHIMGLDVDKCVSLLFTAIIGVIPFAKLFCNCFTISLTLVKCYLSLMTVILT